MSYFSQSGLLLLYTALSQIVCTLHPECVIVFVILENSMEAASRVTLVLLCGTDGSHGPSPLHIFDPLI